MNIDEIGRSAAHEARTVAADGLDPAAMFVRLRRTRRYRAVGSIAAAAAVVVAAAGIAVAQTRSGHNADHDRPARFSNSSAPQCAGVTSLAGRRFRICLPVPVDVTVPANFHTTFNDSGGMVDAYRSDLARTGVSILENHPVPLKDTATLTRDPSAGSDARSVANWLSERPFLENTSVTRVSVGGRPAWRVTGSLRQGANLPAHKDLTPIAPVFQLGGSPIGYGRNIVGDYILLDLPKVGLTVIWSWSDGDGRQALAGNQAFIDGMSFVTG